MADYSVGNTSSSIIQTFLPLTIPVHLPPLISDSAIDSAYLPEAHKALAPSLSAWTDTPPERQGCDFGQVIHYKFINNDNEILKSCQLHVKLAGLKADEESINPRYVDDILLAAIEKIEFQFSAGTLMTLYGDELHFRTLQETPEEELDRKYALQGAGLSKVRRSILAKTDRWYVLEIPFWWARGPQHAWHQYALQRVTRFVITFRDKGYLLQNDFTVNKCPVPATSNVYMVEHFIHCETQVVTEKTKQAYINQIQATGKSGWLYMINDFEHITNVLAPKNTIMLNTELNSLTKFAYNMRILMRPFNNLQPDTRNNQRFHLADIKSIYMDISGKRFLTHIDQNYLKKEMNGKKFLGNLNLPITNIMFSDNPDVHSHAYGGIEFTQAVNPVVHLEYDALPEDYIVDFIVYTHNYVRICISGNASMAEVVQPL